MVYLSSLVAAALAATVSVSGIPLSARQNKPFSLKNGQDAQAQNAHFATLTAGSACKGGDNACIGGGFAQCVNGKFAEVGCSGGTQCFALPLVNKAGTNIACTTQQDAEARIAATGATGGVQGNGKKNNKRVEKDDDKKGKKDDDKKGKKANKKKANKKGKKKGNKKGKKNNKKGKANGKKGKGTGKKVKDVPAPGSKRSPAAPPNAKPFTLQNGKDAQKLNAEFASKNANSPCKAGEQACINGGFGQCVGGKFAVTQCAGGTKCFALPLVNKAGTSITCSTEADASTRIAATGATGGIEGTGKNNAKGDNSNKVQEAPAPAAPKPSQPAAAAAPNAKPFTLQNGKDAQKLNREFASKNANSPCKDGEQACINGGFGQCVGGKFAVTQCAGGTKCFALPLVNKAGTSITCSTDADASARIAATGATGGIQG